MREGGGGTGAEEDKLDGFVGVHAVAQRVDGAHGSVRGGCEGGGGMCSSAHDCSGWRAFMSEAKFADRIDNLVGQYRAMISFYHSVLTLGWMWYPIKRLLYSSSRLLVLALEVLEEG